ncbi:hypothetical protein FTUN_0081 [Frigoriglobus tundricola]|uniref:Uncharacterized protein n=1 Tax=Frigoriglobus tundricola TaxID=2774151 RepID=A0A6M5YG53_9BACT|nr:hypothetical protein FTUN_0081 [Frigoriglobus tundricola]
MEFDARRHVFETIGWVPMIRSPRTRTWVTRTVDGRQVLRTGP